MASEAMLHPGSFQRSIDVYNADCGGELKLSGPDGSSLVVFYFEWDKIEVGGLQELTKHEPETCNKAAGLTLRSHNPNREFQTLDHTSLVFDVTTFADSANLIVYVYKVAWLQGVGCQAMQNGDNRLLRFKNAITRGGGAARVLECGITGARDEDHAWQIFQNQVLQQLTWTAGMAERPARP